MTSVASDPTSVHGLSWKRIYKIRNTVAWRWHYKFSEAIPVEEFMSEGNQVIAESILAFDPQGTGSFATFLYRALNRRMPSVARHELAGTIERTYGDGGKHAKVTSTIYKGPVLCDIPQDPALYDDNNAPPPMPSSLTSQATQEDFTYLHECLAYIGQHMNTHEQVYFESSINGDEAADIGKVHSIHKRVMQRRLKSIRDQLMSWADRNNLDGVESWAVQKSHKASCDIAPMSNTAKLGKVILAR